MLAMGGYGAFVWSAFGASALILLGLLWQSLRAARSRAAELEQLRAVVRPEPARAPTLRRHPGASASQAADGGGGV